MVTKNLQEFSEKVLIKPIFDRTRILEMIAVVFTAVGKFVFMDYLNWRLLFVIVAIISWAIYIIYRRKQDKNILRYWGFRTDNFKQTIKIVLPFGIIAIVSFFVIGYFQNTIIWTWHLIPILITYPIWGSIQQFLTIGLIAGNLKDFKRKQFNHFTIIVITACLFSIVHFPSIWLMFGTFILALFYGYVYLKRKNIYVLGLFHGWLGALFYYTVVNRDPLQEIFLKFL